MMIKKLRLIPFDISMLQECVELYQRVFSKKPWFENDDRSDVEAYFLNFYQNNKFTGYAVKNNGKIVAMSIGFLKPWIKGEKYYIDQFCVDYDQQGQGIRTFLINEIKKDLLKKDIHAIILNTERGYPAYSFYIKNGFISFEDTRILAIEF